MSSTLGFNYSNNNKINNHIYKRKGKINIKKEPHSFYLFNQIGLTLKSSPVESPSVTTKVSTGMTNKNNLIFKIVESPP